MKIRSCLVISFCVLLLGCGPSAVRKYAGVLAADTGELNEKFESLTKSRAEINNTREDLTNSLELAILEAEDYNARRLDVWRDLKGSDKSYETRYNIFTSIQTASEAAFTREDTMEALSAKLDVVRNEATGHKSEELGAAAKSLAALSKEMSLKESLQFIVDYGQNVRTNLKKAGVNAGTASQSATNKAESIKASEIEKDIDKLKSLMK